MMAAARALAQTLDGELLDESCVAGVIQDVPPETIPLRFDQIPRLLGITVDVSYGCLVSENTVEDTQGQGIFLGDSSGCKLYNNVTIIGNSEKKITGPLSLGDRLWTATAITKPRMMRSGVHTNV